MAATIEVVRKVWAQALGLELEFLHADDSFFDVGGSSALATEIAATLCSKHNLAVAAEDVCAFPTVRALVELLDDRDKDRGEIVKTVWAKCLHLDLDLLDPEDCFYDVGGHASIAAEIAAELSSKHGLAITGVDVCAHPSVGKLLEFLECGGSDRGLTLPGNTGAAVRRIWANALGLDIECLDPEECFFDLGGHSRIAEDIAAKLSNACGLVITGSDVCAHSSLQALLKFLECGDFDLGEVVRRVWAKALNLDLHCLELDDSFFDAGGHEGLAEEIARALSGEHGIRVVGADICAHPSITEFLDFMECKGKDQTEIVRSAWAKALNLEPEFLDVEDSFYDLGGHAGIAAEIAAVLSSKHGLVVSGEDVCTHPCVGALVQFLDSSSKGP